MSIKTRLLLSYIAMTFIPVVLFAFIAVMLASVFFKDMAGVGDGRGPFWKASNEHSELIAGVKFTARTDPDRLVDSGFLKRTDEQLQLLQTGLVVMRNNGITFISPNLDAADLGRQLQDPQTSGWGKNTRERYSVSTVDFTFGDGSAGKLFLFSDMNLFYSEASRFFPLLFLSLLLVIGLTNGLLTLLVSRSLIQPLYALRRAAEQIKEGDLSQKVNLKRKDEIGEVGAAFEEMRIRLNDSIRLQLQYEENRKDLISSISHDLKTPIAGIKACVEGIRDGIADTEPKREKYMSMIAKKTDDMDRLIDELFLFSKLDLKRLPFNLEAIDLAAYLRDCAEEFRADPRMNGTTVAFAYAGEGPVIVIADREKLRRVIMNIIDNSLKYMNKTKPEIILELLDGEGAATVKIEDNGEGIMEEALPHIFDRFYRAEPSRNTDTGSSGLGLAIVKQIVEGQGGKVWAESRTGEGTAIYFTLPKTRQAVNGHETDLNH
ncbi:sensor histidine kinase [Paenibacillus piri]|uniref:histidine kinase n=1 Tax=Paenibacillus piri TaxID=2547395 RepID=A0A4R5KJB0_9BACL|nr:HAMP domain-containing sensor histidine kinase [Paenibacillus piri]TDF94400.1 HAMP domain-containing histidine kinase [Paenibacillus piri]